MFLRRDAAAARRGDGRLPHIRPNLLVPTLPVDLSLPLHGSYLPAAPLTPDLAAFVHLISLKKGLNGQLVAFVHLILAVVPVSRLFVPFSCTFAINEGLRGDFAEISCTFALNRSSVPQTNLSRFTYCRNNTPRIRSPTTLPQTYFAYIMTPTHRHQHTDTNTPTPTHRHQHTGTNKPSPTTTANPTYRRMRWTWRRAICFSRS